MMHPEVVILMCTFNRHLLLERAIGSFIDQDYPGRHTLVVYNTGVPVIFQNPSLPPNKEIKFYNNDVDYVTNKAYTNVGDKHRDMLKLAPRADIYNHQCDDDYMLPNHISEGVKGLTNVMIKGYSVYKPSVSFYRDKDGLTRQKNVMEPSMFILGADLKRYGYLPNSVKYHDGWLLPLQSEDAVYTDPEGIPTFVYDWSGEQPAFRLSGRGTDDDKNFQDSQRFPDGFNDGLVTPLSHEQMLPYYKLTEGI